MGPNRSIKEDRGVTSVEYGLIASAIAVAIIIVVFSLGTHVASLFNSLHF